MKTSLLSALSLALCAACASAPPGPAAPIPDALKPAASETALTTLAARGVQIYECRAKKDAPAATEWVFVAPEADLFDAQGKPAGKHYAGPHWENADGSKVAGSVKARADAPAAGAIPWLLLTAKSVGTPGAFAGIGSIQRINTVGGVAPADGCSAATLGRSTRVAYRADYVMFVSR